MMAALSSNSARADLITNGDFQTGSLTGWTAFTTSNGTVGFGMPNVLLFDTTGSGASDAAHFNVGEVIFQEGQAAGGGVMQTIFIPVDGLYRFSEDFASLANSLSNADAGTFSLLIDGSTVATESVGLIHSTEILRGSLAVDVDLTAGSHLIAAEITRGFISSGVGSTPEQYIDNISLNPTTVTPEPSTFARWGLVSSVQREQSGVVSRLSSTDIGLLRVFG